jgi:hypothetical protein
VLRDIAKKYGALITAAGEKRFQLPTKRNINCGPCGCFAKPGIWRSTVPIFQCHVWRALAADVRVDLYSSHLIHGR